jgi:hypothetical protein
MNYILLFAYFSFGRILYCSIHPNDDKKVLLYDPFYTLLFFMSATLWHYFVDWFYDGVVIAMLYIFTAIICRKHVYKNKDDWIGIIDFSWLSLLGITCGGILLANNFDIIKKEFVVPGYEPRYYIQLSEEYKFLLDKLFYFVVSLATILAACMTILWYGGIWRSKDIVMNSKLAKNQPEAFNKLEAFHLKKLKGVPNSQDIINEYKQFILSKNAAISMAVAYFEILFAVIFWIILPIYQNYNKSISMLR